MQRVGASSLRLHARKRRIEAKRRCGWSVDGRWSVREGGRIARRRDFRRSGRRKLETAARRKAVFHIPRAKESKRVKETGERGLPSSFKQDRFFSQKKKKKDSQTLPHFRSKTIVRFKDRWIENGENLWEKKERKKGGRGIRQSAEGKVRYYGLTSWCIPVRLSVSDFSKTLHDSWKLVDE